MPEYLKQPPRQKKPKKRLTPVSKKQQRYNKERQKAYQEMESHPQYCRGCGTSQNLSHSHRITQADKRHVANPKAIDFYCLGENSCHTAYENGFLWRLDNGAEVMEWLKETDFDAYRRKRLQMLRRVEESGICIEDLPGWTQEILNEIQ